MGNRALPRPITPSRNASTVIWVSDINIQSLYFQAETAQNRYRKKSKQYFINQLTNLGWAPRIPINSQRSFYEIKGLTQ